MFTAINTKEISTEMTTATRGPLGVLAWVVGPLGGCLVHHAFLKECAADSASMLPVHILGKNA